MPSHHPNSNLSSVYPLYDPQSAFNCCLLPLHYMDGIYGCYICRTEVPTKQGTCTFLNSFDGQLVAVSMTAAKMSRQLGISMPEAARKCLHDFNDSISDMYSWVDQYIADAKKTFHT